MPIEQAQYIDTLQPDWPLGTDPESQGDDHLRMVKQVLKNAFPGVNAKVNATAADLNGITDHLQYLPADSSDAQNIVPEHLTAWNSDRTAALQVFIGRASAKQPDAAVSFGLLVDLFYPVGSIYMNGSNTNNPATWLGFGTWVPVMGYIAGGNGAIPDTDGAIQQWGLGAVTGYWHIHQEHITPFEVPLAMDAVPDHVHSFPNLAVNNDTSTNGGGANTYTDGTGQTGGAGGHTPTGKVTIGAGTSMYTPPTQAVAAWMRTA